MESPTPLFVEVEKTARDYGVSLRRLQRDDSFAFDGVQVRVLNPQPGWQARDPADDDESLVLRLQYGQTSALLVGDAHRRIEKYLVDESPQADLLKVGHHGSATSSTPEFLAAVKPRYAVVSVGLYNPFRHPRADVMQRYAGAGIRTYRTDLTGAVSFLLDGSRITVLPGSR